MQLHSPGSRIGGVIFMRKMQVLLGSGSNMTDMSVNVQCYTVFLCIPVLDVDSVMQLWHLLTTANHILVIGMYVSYVRKIAVNRLDNIPLTESWQSHQMIWNSCTLTWWITSWNYMIWVSYQIGCQLDEPCGFSGDHWQMQHCFNVLTDIYTVFFLALFNCYILLKIKLITITITCEFNWLWWWLSNGSNHRNGGGGSACDMNGNVKLKFDYRVAWHEFCEGSAEKQEVDKARQRQKKCASSLTSSSPVKSRWSSTLNWTKSE